MLYKLILTLLFSVGVMAAYIYFPAVTETRQCKSNFELPANAYWNTDCWWGCKPGWNKNVINSVCLFDPTYKDTDKKEKSHTEKKSSLPKVTTNYIDYKDLLSDTKHCHVIPDKLEENGTIAISCADDNLQTTEIICELEDESETIKSSFVSCELLVDSDNIECVSRLDKYKEDRASFIAKSCQLNQGYQE